MSVLLAPHFTRMHDNHAINLDQSSEDRWMTNGRTNRLPKLLCASTQLYDYMLLIFLYFLQVMGGEERILK